MEVSEELFAPDLAALLAQAPKRLTAVKRTKCVLNIGIILKNIECEYRGNIIPAVQVRVVPGNTELITWHCFGIICVLSVIWQKQDQS
jgi:hypothetical protein